MQPLELEAGGGNPGGIAATEVECDGSLRHLPRVIVSLRAMVKTRCWTKAATRVKKATD